MIISPSSSYHLIDLTDLILGRSRSFDNVSHPDNVKKVNLSKITGKREEEPQKVSNLTDESKRTSMFSSPAALRSLYASKNFMAPFKSTIENFKKMKRQPSAQEGMLMVHVGI